MGTFRRAQVAVLAVMAAGCTTVLDPTPTPGAPTGQVPTTAGLSSAPAASTPVATSVLTERERSDRFWRRVITYAPMAFAFRTLEDIVAGSELIVRGRIGGRTTANCPAGASQPPAKPDICEGGVRSFAIVAVEQVLKADGRYASGSVLVELALSGIPDAELPNGDLVLFLKNDGKFYVDEGLPQPSDSPRWQWYFLANSYQGALRNLDGVVDVPAAPDGWWDDYGPFPSDIDGQPFDVVVARIRSLVGS